MKNIPILIVPATREFETFDADRDPNSVLGWYRWSPELLRANIVIVRGLKHFCCIKNRWGTICARDRIPNYMLQSYLKQFHKYLTKESLIDALCDIQLKADDQH